MLFLSEDFTIYTTFVLVKTYISDCSQIKDPIITGNKNLDMLNKLFIKS